MDEINDPHFQNFFNNLQNVVENSKNLPEMTLRIRIEQKLHTFMEDEHDINLTKYGLFGHDEIGTIKLKGEPDAIYGKLILDYKAVGELRNYKQREAITDDFKEKYLNPIPIHLRKFFKGVIFDGEKFIFLRWEEKSEKWSKDVINFTKESLFRFLKWLEESVSRNPSPDILSKTFSLDKNYVKKLVSILHSRLDSELGKGSEISGCFKRWHDIFIFLYGGVLSGTKVREDIADVADFLQKEIDPAPFLFTLFTYYTFVIELICGEVLCASMDISRLSRSLLKSKNLKDKLNSVLRGKFFEENFNLANYTEGLNDFTWFLDVWSDELERPIRSIIEKTAEFDFLVIAGLTSKDVLKGLYENIVPHQLRHNLGEIFTPEWLTELALNRVGYDGDMNRRLLDPGCGRGVFLGEAIVRVIRANRDSIDDDKLTQRILKNIVGFDINPIAVITARANYLLTMSPLLPAIRKLRQPATLPIFLTDSILTPTKDDVGDSDAYKLSTSTGELELPIEAADKGGIEKLIRILKRLTGITPDKKDRNDIIAEEVPNTSAEKIKDFLRFYSAFEELDKHERNAIINLFGSLYAPLKYLNHFDFVVGNPPWIKWEFLARDYKRKLDALYLKVYKLFSHGGMKAGMGYAHDDISVVFAYVALDKYLKDEGKAAFLLKQTLYKSPADVEFRKFCIEKATGNIPLKVTEVHDLTDIKPFTPWQSETSLIALEKGSKTKYPVPYYSWSVKEGRSLGEILKSDSLSKVEESVNVNRRDAYPDPSEGMDTALWVIVEKGKEPSKISPGITSCDVRHGIVDDLDAIFQVKPLSKSSHGFLLIENMQSGRKKVQQVTIEIEPDLIFPLLKPRHVDKWITRGYDYTILPQRKYGENNEYELMKRYPRTYNYLNMFKSELQERSSRWFKGHPFYTVFGVGDYTFKPYKVVWSAIGYLPNFAIVGSVEDQYIGHKVIIPDNTICFIPMNSKPEADFLCAILNSSYIKRIIEQRATKSKWSLSSELIKKVLRPIPTFDLNNPDHQTLSSLARKAQQLAVSDEELSNVELEIDELIEGILGKIA